MADNGGLSERGAAMRGDSTLLFTGYILAQRNPFDFASNRGGCINLGTSENKLMFDLLSEKFNDPACRRIEESATMYGDHTGVAPFRDEIAALFNRHMRPLIPVQPSELCVMTGAGTVIEALALSLCDVGEGILIPTPYYGGFDMDLSKRARAVPCPVDTTPETSFALTNDALEKGLAAATAKGFRVRALIVCSPNNPLGTFYSRAEMQTCLDFCHRHSLHCIFDELYFLSSFAEGSSPERKGFIPVLTLDSIPDPTRLHLVWSFSKDFSISGFRVGVVQTRNPQLTEVLGQMSYFTGVSIPTQHLLCNALRDLNWVGRYLAAMRSRLAHAASIVTRAMDDLGAPYIRPAAGFFVWVDFGGFLAARTVDNELSLWRALIDAGLYIAPGQAFHCVQPGWFRIVFADKDEVIALAMSRLVAYLRPTAAKPRTAAEECERALCGPAVDEGGSASRAVGSGDGESLEDLVRLLKGQIRATDWLQATGDPRE